MQIRDIEYVAAVAEYGNFSRAAEKLFISQPALSQQIARLEAELQVQLFKREKKMVLPTEACLVLLEDGKKILKLRDHILEQMGGFSKLKTGKLNISIASYYHTRYLAPLLLKFHELYPGIKLSVVEAYYVEQTKMLREGKVDLCITSLPLLDKNMDCKKLFEEDIQLAVPHDHPANAYLAAYAGKKLTLEQLRLVKDESFIMYEEGRHLRQKVLDLCKAAGFTPRTVYETQSCESITGLIHQGMGLGFLPKGIYKYYDSNIHPICYDIDDPLARQTFVMVYRKGELFRSAQAFYDFLEAEGNLKEEAADAPAEKAE